MDDLLTQTQDPCSWGSIGIDERRVSQGPWPSRNMNDILQTLRREMQVGKSGSDEQLGRLVIRMLIDQVWINDNGRLERRHDLLQVGEEIHSRLWLARNCGFHVGDRLRVCDAAPVGLRCPYIHEDVRQSSVRIPKEDEVIRTQAEHVCCILRLLHSLVTDVPKLCGRDWRRPPEQRRTHDIVIARRHPQHSD